MATNPSIPISQPNGSADLSPTENGLRSGPIHREQGSASYQVLKTVRRKKGEKGLWDESPELSRVCSALVSAELLTVCALQTAVTDLSLPPLTLKAISEALTAVPTLSLPQNTLHLLPLFRGTAQPLPGAPATSVPRSRWTPSLIPTPATGPQWFFPSPPLPPTLRRAQLSSLNLSLIFMQSQRAQPRVLAEGWTKGPAVISPVPVSPPAVKQTVLEPEGNHGASHFHPERDKGEVRCCI